VNVTPTPTTNISASSLSICAGQSATLTASGAATYAWLPGAQTTTVIAVTPTITTTYTVTGTTTGCSSNRTITVNVSSTPTVAASVTNTTICRGSSVNVAVTGATTYTWLPSGSGSSSALSPTTTTIYTITGSNGSCNSAPRTVTVNVTPSPTVNVIASPTIICTGQTATLTASGATTYAWLPGAQTTPAIAVTPTITTTYTINGTTAGCSGNNVITLTVSTCTGIDNISSTSSHLFVFPNPSNGVFTISNTINTDKLEVTIINTLGQTVITETAKNTHQLSFDLTKMSKGIYYAKVTTDEGTQLLKLILE
jgi:hypothetical protein